MPPVPPQHPQLHTYRSCRERSDKREAYRIPRRVGHTPRPQRDSRVADIHDGDGDSHDDRPRLGLLSEDFSHPRHKTRRAGVGCIRKEVERQDCCAISGPGAEHDQANSQGARGPDADLPAPVFPVRKGIENQTRDYLQRVAAEGNNVDVIGVVAEALEVEHEVRVGAV